MSFVTVSNNARGRFNENLIFLNYVSALEPNNPRDITTPEVNIMKGLFYVHMYSSLEKTINELIEHAILLIDSKSIQSKHYNNTFYTISHHHKLQAFKSCNHKNFFSKAYEIFSEINNNNVTSLNETIFYNNLQNVWYNTIREVTQCFGIKGLENNPRVVTTINEIVERRNAVAHGRESASEVGERFRCDILRIKLNEISTFTYELIELYENYFKKKDYLKSGAKRLYT